MKITTHGRRKHIKKVEEPKKVVEEVKKEEVPKYKVVLPKEELIEEPLFSPEVEKLLEEDEDIE